MKRVERIYQLHQELTHRRHPVSMAMLCEKLECSPATVKRVLQEMRGSLNAPIETVKDQGYRYQADITYELPGLWFREDELHALLIAQQMLGRLGSPWLQSQIKPLQNKVETLLHHSGQNSKNIAQRIHIISSGQRQQKLPYFPLVAGAVLSRKQLCFDYYARGSGKTRPRTVSPQQLSYHRENWYLDAWCHQADGLRSFSLDGIQQPEVQKQTAKEISTKQLKQHFDAAYGVFGGQVEHIAMLHFNAYRARWIKDEQWHPQQQGKLHPDGSYTLELPYANATELILDICRYGPDVEVIEPPALRQAVAERLQQAAAQYQKKH